MQLKLQKIKTSGNIAYKIKYGRGYYLLRLSPKTGLRRRSQAEIAAELKIINYLRKNHFPTPELITKVITINGQVGYIRKYISGYVIKRPTANQAKQVGMILGRLHNLTINHKFNNTRRHHWDIAHAQQVCRELNYRDLLFNTIKTEILKLKLPVNLPKGMLHEDLGCRHVIWQKNKIVGIIDFDRAYYGPLILDIGQAIRGWGDNIINGYQRQRKLSRIEKKYLPTAIKFAWLERALSFYINKDKKYARTCLRRALEFNELMIT